MRKSLVSRTAAASLLRFLKVVKRALLLTSPASLTVEAAIVVPLFAACMAAVLQFGNVYHSAARFSCILAQTGEEMAIASYASAYTKTDSPLPVILSAGYAAGRVETLAGKTPSVRHRNLLLSSFLAAEDSIDLVMTYQVQTPSGLVKIPGILFLQRARVRGWVGRHGSGASDPSDENEEDHQTVYVTEYGTVYHTDPDCTHIHLSISSVGYEEAQKARNVYGEKYHACEKCGGGTGGTVYITTDGNRFHSTLSCSGLKRSTRAVTKEEAEYLRPCSKCAGGS